VFQGETELESLKTERWLFLQLNVQCAYQFLELAKMTVSGQKQVKSGTNLEVTVFARYHGLDCNGSFRCLQASCVANKPNCQSKVSPREHSLPFLPNDINNEVIPE
jgi:hypothetical protein